RNSFSRWEKVRMKALSFADIFILVNSRVTPALHADFPERLFSRHYTLRCIAIRRCARITGAGVRASQDLVGMPLPPSQSRHCLGRYCALRLLSPGRSAKLPRNIPGARLHRDVISSLVPSLRAARRRFVAPRDCRSWLAEFSILQTPEAQSTEQSAPSRKSEARKAAGTIAEDQRRSVDIRYPPAFLAGPPQPQALT